MYCTKLQAYRSQARCPAMPQYTQSQIARLPVHKLWEVVGELGMVVPDHILDLELRAVIARKMAGGEPARFTKYSKLFSCRAPQSVLRSGLMEIPLQVCLCGIRPPADGKQKSEGEKNGSAASCKDRVGGKFLILVLIRCMRI